LEVDADGVLVWPVVVLTVPRQSTKSTLMSEVMAWRIHQADRFGERQIAVHTANKLQAAIRIQEDLHGWAEGCGYKVSRRTGQERVTLPDSSRWEITSLRAAYGSRPSFVFVDEAFDVPRALVEKALLPAQARRKSPQIWLVSTANSECTDLMLEYRARGRAGSDRVCVLEWGLPAGGDPLDEGWWWASNPVPSAAYVEMVRANVGSSDWVAQWLNVWPPLAVDTGWVGRDRWDALAWSGDWPEGPVSIAVEASPGQDWAVARAVKVSEGRVVVEALPVESPAQVRDVVNRWRVPGAQVVAGKGVLWACDPMWAAEPVTHTQHYAEASAVFVEGVRRGGFAHVAQPDLDRQVCSMVLKGVGQGAILRGSPDFVARCGVWAVWAAHQRASEFLLV
jgi:hypothetical protein